MYKILEMSHVLFMAEINIILIICYVNFMINWFDDAEFD